MKSCDEAIDEASCCMGFECTLLLQSDSGLDMFSPALLFNVFVAVCSTFETAFWLLSTAVGSLLPNLAVVWLFAVADVFIWLLLL